MAVVIAIDAGTTGVRAFAVDEQGQPAGGSYREFTQHFPRPGWVEHDATEIWTTVQTVLAELVASIEQPVAAIGITDQRGTACRWAPSGGKPLPRASGWQDPPPPARFRRPPPAGHLP